MFSLNINAQTRQIEGSLRHLLETARQPPFKCLLLYGLIPQEAIEAANAAFDVKLADRLYTPFTEGPDRPLISA